ncbi:hypothetical protein ARAM_001205 [Aspergillus rambellii]|uniref:F-box domain-containing protein n=1 Tax=Aspergillus rambellii TaxID=308745 RepID=A0A0F8V6X0_9EURO|nr:hypothetical protein ARAM_001205 [Aspergillus rambellii]
MEVTGIPPAVTKRLLDFVPQDCRHSLRLTCKSWAQAIDQVAPLPRPAANVIPSEILLQIFYQLSPRDFDNARRACSQWMRASLNERLLERMLKRAGWWDSWKWDNRNANSMEYGEQSLAWRMSKRFATECVLSGRKVNVERTGFLTTSVVDFSQLSQGEYPPDPRPLSDSAAYSKESLEDAPSMSRFHVSTCGNYLLVVAGCMIYVYELLAKRSESAVPVSVEDLKHLDIAAVASIACPVEVLSATIDTSTSIFVVAALLQNRVGMVCDLVPADRRDSLKSTAMAYKGIGVRPGRVCSMKMAARHFYYDVCSAKDPPRSISICPGHRCVAFGAGSGIELRWVDEQTHRDCRKHFPMSQPSEILHFLPNRPDTPLEFRLISSLAGPGVSGCGCQHLPYGETRPSCPFHVMNDVQTFSSWAPEQKDRVGLVRATQCHHYSAIPVNDGLHVLFIEPRSGLLCIGSDAPIDGPTSLTRALICVPPFGIDASDTKETPVPTVFTAGSDLNWGLRVVAAYGDRIVLYSVPLDVFNVIRKERKRQGDGVMADSDLARDFFLNHQLSQKRRGSLAQNQNGDWEFLLSIRYRPTAMMWPFKIYGKEIGRVDNVVELALQSSHGGARVWAFGASGEASILDVDTLSSVSQQVSDIPCKSFSIGADGCIASAQLVNRSESEHGLPLLGSSRKRKQCEPRADFTGQHMLRQHNSLFLDGHEPSSSSVLSSTSTRRASFSAYIVDFKIPELEGRWMETEAVY